MSTTDGIRNETEQDHGKKENHAMKLSRIDEMQAGEIHRAGRADRLAWLRERERAADELFEKLVELRLKFHLPFLLANSESPPGTSASASSTGPESCSLPQDDVEEPPEARARGPPRRKSPGGD